MKKQRTNKAQQEFKYRQREVTAEFKALEQKCNQSANKLGVRDIMTDLQQDPPPVKKSLFTIGCLVTGTGVDIQRVVAMDELGKIGKFKCLSDPTQNFEVGAIEENRFDLYYRITEISFVRLHAIAKSCGWIIDLETLEKL